MQSPLKRPAGCSTVAVYTWKSLPPAGNGGDSSTDAQRRRGFPWAFTRKSVLRRLAKSGKRLESF
jgi:hypothetical protein